MIDEDHIVIAGHYFSNGVCVRENEKGEICGRRLCDILCFGAANRGELGIAHAGSLADYEASQIEAEAEKQRKAINAAMGWDPKPKDADDD